MPRLEAPESGITVRMYRQGHGDCFLLALPPEHGDDPVYVLIDCGFKPGSQKFVHDKHIRDIVAHIGEATNNRLDLVVVTHEHQDHLNGIWYEGTPFFDRFSIQEAWMAWTEDPVDALAIELRQLHEDQLLNLVSARQRLALAESDDDPTVHRIDSLLSLEFGGGEDALAGKALLAAAADPSKSENKQAMKLVKDKANENRGVRYLSPGERPHTIPGSAVRAFVLGPPRDPALLKDETPKASEAFPDDSPFGFAFEAALGTAPEALSAPFNARFTVPWQTALNKSNSFFVNHYGKGKEGTNDSKNIPVLDNAPWRRIDNDWLYSAETLGLALNAGVNNTSLALAFELPVSKKVLLFIGDAQRGNWISWNHVTWQDDETTVSARDLLARTALYKVGHHGSHNATLSGSASDTYANLYWMGTALGGGEFTAMITAVNEWALKKKDPWVHPLPAIKSALIQKAQGRVFQTDTDRPQKPEAVPDELWDAFLSRCTFDDLYFDYTVLDA